MRNRDDDDRGSRRGRDDDEGRGSRGRSSGGRGGFVYQQRSAEDNRKRAESKGRDFDSIYKDGVTLYKVKDGDNSIRVLPPTFEGAKHYGLDIEVHFGVGPDRATYLCPNKMLGKPCPLCEARQDAQRDGDDELAKELAPKKRVLIALIDRDDEKAGVQLWGMPWTVDRDLAQVAVDRKTKEVLPIDHPEDGYDISFVKQGKERNTKYGGIQVDRNSSPLGRRGDEWLDYIQENPLDTLLNYVSYDDIAKAFNGGGSGGGARKRDRDSDDRDDDRSSRRGRDRDDDKSADLSWDDIHSMKPRELEDLAEEHGIKASKYDDDEELADAICDKLDISKPKPRRSPGRDSDDRDDDRSSRRRSSEDDEDEKPRRSSRDDDDDDVPKTRRRTADDDGDAEDGMRKMRRRSE